MTYKSKKDTQTDCASETLTISITEILNNVLTLKEACAMLNVADSTLRTRVLNGEFSKWECRKSGGVILFNKKAIENRIDSFRLRKPKK